MLDFDKSIINDDRVKMRVVGSMMEPHPIAASGEGDFGYQTVKNSIRQIWNNTCVAPGESSFMLYLRQCSISCKNILTFSLDVHLSVHHSYVHSISLKPHERFGNNLMCMVTLSATCADCNIQLG